MSELRDGSHVWLSCSPSAGVFSHTFINNFFFLSLNPAFVLDPILPLLCFLCTLSCLSLATISLPLASMAPTSANHKPTCAPGEKAPPSTGSHLSHLPGPLSSKILSEFVSSSPSLLPALQLHATIISLLVSHKSPVLGLRCPWDPLAVYSPHGK